MLIKSLLDSLNEPTINELVKELESRGFLARD